MGGILNSLGSSFGSWGGSAYGSAPAAAQGAMGLGTLATGTNVAASLFSGIAGANAAGFSKQIARQNVGAALEAGQTSEEESKIHYGALVGREKAQQAAGGVAVGTGSAAAVRQSTEEIGAMDAALIHYNAAREAFGSKVQEAQFGAERTNKLLEGVTGAATSFLSGASALSSKYLSFQLSGANQQPGTNPMQIPVTG